MEECLKEKQLKERIDEKEWMNEEQMKKERMNEEQMKEQLSRCLTLKLINS